MALPDYTVEIVAENASPLPNYRVAVVLDGATPRPDFTVGSPAAGVLPDFRVARVLADATPLPDFRVAGIGIDDFRTAMPADSTYTRSGAATGLTAAGLISTFAADAPQRTDRGLLLEPAATNLVANSNDVSGAGWTLSTANGSQPVGSGSTLNVATDAYGNVAADFVAEFTNTGEHLAFPNLDTTIARHVVSYMLKAGTRTKARVQIGRALAANGAFVDVDLSAGTIGAVTNEGTGFTGVSAQIVALANGFYRVSVVADSTLAGNVAAYVQPLDGSGAASYTGDGVSGIILGGADRAVMGTVTSPIVTTGASATRGLPVFTEPVPAGCSKALLTYADATTTLVTGLTPGGTFDVAAAVVGAGKGLFGVSELVTRAWLA